MKQIMWALVVIGLLLVGSAIPAEVAAGAPGGGFHGGGARSAGGGGWHGASPQGAGAWYGGGGGAYRGGGGAWYGGGARYYGGGGRYYGGGGRYYGGGGGWYGGTRVYIGGGYGWWGWPGYWGPGYWGAPYPYSAPSPTVIQQAPTEYIQQESAPPQQAYWYYCQNAGAYYPYVKDCPGGWMQVVPSPAPPVP